MAGKNTAVIGIYKGSAFGAREKWVLPQFPCNSGDNRAGVAPITAFESVLAPQAALAWVIVLAHSGDLACKCSEHSHLCASVRQYLHGNCGRASKGLQTWSDRNVPSSKGAWLLFRAMY